MGVPTALCRAAPQKASRELFLTFNGINQYHLIYADIPSRDALDHSTTVYSVPGVWLRLPGMFRL